MTRKAQLTKALIDKTECPEGKQEFWLQDAAVSGLAVRITPTQRSWFIYRKIHGRPLKKRIGGYPALTIEQARKKATLLNAEVEKIGRAAVIPPKQEEKPTKSVEDFTVESAMEHALSFTHRADRSRDDWKREVKHFDAWVKKKHPAIIRWTDVSRSMIREYMTAAETRGLSPNRVRLLLNPICQTSLLFSKDFDIPHVARDLGIRAKLKNDVPDVSILDVLDFIQYAKDKDFTVHVAAALQGLAALRALEACRLTWNSIDLEAGLLSIEGITKNEHSKRVLPLCKQLVAILKEAKQRKDEADRETKGRVIPMDGGPVLASPQGMAFVGNSYMNISHRVNQLLVAWKTDLPWRGKDLRKCLPSWAGSTARDGQVLESYLGHAPQGITSRHYQSALLPPSLKPRTLGEKDEHEARIKRVKNLLLEPWELAIEESRVRLAELKAKEKDGAVVALGEVAQ